MSDDLKADVIASLELGSALADTIRNHGLMTAAEVAMVRRRLADIAARVRRSRVIEPPWTPPRASRPSSSSYRYH